jgi:hypothetical protein
MLGVGFGATLSGIEHDDFLDSLQCGEQALHRDVDTRLFDPAVRQRSQQHRYRTRETVDVDFLIGPMIQRPPTTDVSIFHLLKDVFNVELPPVSSNDLGIIPLLSVCDDKVLAQIGIR